MLRSDIYNVFYENQKFYEKNPKYTKLLENIDYYYSLLYNIDSFTPEQFVMATKFNDYKINIENTDNPLSMIAEYLKMVTSTGHLDLQQLLRNLMATLYSVRLCIQVVNISDAMTLFRRFKDDFFLYIFFTKIGAASLKRDTKEEIDRWNKQVDHVFRWLGNEMKGVYYQGIIQFLLEDENIAELDKEIHLFTSIKELTNELNNFAHSNGMHFLNKLNHVHNEKETERFFDFLSIELNRLFAYMITLLFYISPKYMASSDYVDYLDMGQKPPKNSQYWVAPYIQNYIDNKVAKVDPALKKFLKDKSGMLIK